MIDVARDTAKFLPHPICTGCDYNKFGLNFLLMLKSKRARYYAKKDYAKMRLKTYFGAMARNSISPA